MYRFINRWFFLLGFLLGSIVAAYAQDPAVVRARQIYEWFVAGQGDSIHAALNKDVQAKTSPMLFNDTFRQTEKMFGALQKAGEWQTDSVQGVVVYYSDLTFERYNLRFLLAFDPDGKLNTLR